MPGKSGPPPAFHRAFWFGIAFWALICLAAVLIRGVRWEEGYERAQVLLGITPYPDGHPHHRWVWNGFSIHYYLTGAALWLTHSAALVCGARQFLATLAIHLPVFALTALLSRRTLPAHVAMVLSIAGANSIFQSYMPIEPWANKATSGLMGMGWALWVLVALCAGRWRAAGLLFGLMPLVHLGQWPMVLLTTAATAAGLWWRGDRAAWLGLVRWGAVGLACCAAFAVAQRPLLVPDPADGAYHSDRDGHAIWAEYTTHEDMHRALTDWPRFGPMGHSIMALTGFLILALPLTARGAKQDLPVRVLYAYGLLSAAAIAFARVLHHLTETDVPYIAVSWMPYRLTIHISMLLLCAVCAWACGRKQGGISWVPLAALGWLAAQPLWPVLLPESWVQRYFATPETALFLLAGGAISFLWQELPPSGAFNLVKVAYYLVRRPKTVFPANAGIQERGHANRRAPLDSRVRGKDAAVLQHKLVGLGSPKHPESTATSLGLQRGWGALAVAGMLALGAYHQLAGAAVLAGALLALAERHFDRVRPPARAVNTVALTLAALASTFLHEFRHREELPVTPFESQMAEYLAAHSAPSDMVLTPLEEHYQMVLNRPVVATFETRQFMAYMTSLAATTDKLFADLYGVKDGHWYDWDLWKARTEAEWRALGRAYGFRYVLSKDFYPLHLPERLAGEGLILYEIPDAR